MYFFFLRMNLIYKWTILKFIKEYSYFLGNILVGVRVVFLSNCPLILSLLKHKGIGVFLN